MTLQIVFLIFILFYFYTIGFAVFDCANGKPMFIACFYQVLIGYIVYKKNETTGFVINKIKDNIIHPVSVKVKKKKKKTQLIGFLYQLVDSSINICISLDSLIV